MKGKHANAAARRREFEALEKRADAAERRVPQLEGELTELREKTDRLILGLRREVSELIRQRDEAAAPEVAALEEQNRQLRSERDDAVARADREVERWGRTYTQYRELLRMIGFSFAEATEIAVSTTSDELKHNWLLVDESAGIAKHKAKKLPDGAVERIQASRGQRSNTSLKARLIAALNETTTPAENES